MEDLTNTVVIKFQITSQRLKIAAALSSSSLLGSARRNRRRHGNEDKCIEILFLAWCRVDFPFPTAGSIR